MAVPQASFSQGFARRQSESAFPHLWNGLLGAWIPSLGPQGLTSLRDLSGNNNDGSYVGTWTGADWLPTEHGAALNYNGAEADDINCGDITASEGIPQLTLAFWARRTAAGNFVGCGKGDANDNRWHIGFWSDGNIYWLMCNGSSVLASVASNDTAWHHVAMCFDGLRATASERIDFYLDGIRQTGSATWPATTPAVAASFFLGQFYVSGDVQTTGEIGDCYLYSRTLAQTEVLDLIHGRTPFVPARRIRAAPEESGAIILTPDAAEVVWTGQDPTISLGTATLTPDAATVTWTGVDPTIALGTVTLTPDSATVAWTGVDPTIALGTVTLTPDAATVAWTGVDPTMVLGVVTLTPDAAEVVWTGIDATLVQTGVQTILAGVSVVTWTSNDAGLLIRPLPAAASVQWIALDATIDMGGAAQAVACCPTDPFGYNAATATANTAGTERSLVKCNDNATFSYTVAP